jgi:uncharacterized protein YecE (DUF72 family)
LPAIASHGIEQASLIDMRAKQSASRKSPANQSPKSSKGEAVVRLGPAGWLYKDWEGIVYPSEKPKGFDPLRYIADFFDTVEINSTFYGAPLPRTTTSWVNRVKDHRDFRFTAKLWKRFTHERDKAWTRGEVDQVRQGFDVMMDAGKLGAVLLQFPWSFKRSDETREWLGDVVRTFHMYPLVVEVRHTSWLAPEFLESLKEEGVGFVNIDQPMYHKSIGPSTHVTSSVGYVRVHGRNYKDWFREKATVEQRYDYLYKATELEPWAERAREIAASPESREVYVVTNNHYKGKAVANALMMKSMLAGAKVPAPSGIIDAYANAVGDYTIPAENRLEVA